LINYAVFIDLLRRSAKWHRMAVNLNRWQNLAKSDSHLTRITCIIDLVRHRTTLNLSPFDQVRYKGEGKHCFHCALEPNCSKEVCRVCSLSIINISAPLALVINVSK